jgi:hypothetical protein
MPDSVGNVLTLNSKGDISAEFTGHVDAAGLDLPLPVGGLVPQDENRIQWKRVLDGVARGGIYATQLAGDTAAITDLYALSPLTGTHHADVIAHADDAGGANNRVDVQADTQQRTLLAANGDSDYLRYEGFTVTNLNGPWGGGAPPSGTAGQPFPIRATRGLIICWCTAYTAAGGMRVGVYLNGFGAGEMIMNSGAPVNVHTMLTPMVGLWGPATPGGTGYVWFQITAGASDSGDRGGIVVIQ